MTEDKCLEDLLAGLGGSFPFLCSTCADEHLLEVAKRLSQWRNVAPWLGFGISCIEALEHNKFDEEGKKQQMLALWKQREGHDATYRTLAAALLKASRTDLAETVLQYSKVVPAVLKNGLGMSSQSSLHSSCYHTPQGTHPNSVYSTPTYGAASMSPALTRSANNHFGQQTTLAFTHPPSFSGGQEVAQLLQPVPPSTTHQQAIVPPHTVQHLEHVGAPMQTNDKSASMTSKLCISQRPPYYSDAVLQKIDSVCEVGTVYGVPPQNTVEMKQLKSRVEQLEVELQVTQRRYEQERREHEYQRSEYEGIIRLLKQHLQNAQSDAKLFESIVGQLTHKLRRMEMRVTGQDSTDSANSSVDDCNSSIDSNNGAEEVNCHVVRTLVCELREEISRTVVRSTSCLASEGGCSSTHDHCTHKDNVCDKFSQLQLSFEEKHTEIVRRLEEKRESEMAAFSITFLEANTKMTEVVSQSLECLSAECGDSAGLVDDLKWLQKNLDTCRVARHASWP